MMNLVLTSEQIDDARGWRWGRGNPPKRIKELMRQRDSEMKFLRFHRKWSLQKIANRYRISRERVRQILGNTGFYASKTENTLQNQDWLIKNFHKTDSEIAEQIGVSVITVRRYRANTRRPIDGEGDSPLKVGIRWERWASKLLRSKMIENDLMPYKHPFDILALDCVRIDVKVSSEPSIPPSLENVLVNPRWHFHLGNNGKRYDCDFYLWILGETEEVFVVPSLEISPNRRDVYFSWPTKRPDLFKWEEYLGAYDLIHEFAIKCV